MATFNRLRPESGGMAFEQAAKGFDAEFRGLGLEDAANLKASILL
tara:strand:- start:1351 stop:1485 length:135 start_codon:yes stop_codon:yes gene_type:complete